MIRTAGGIACAMSIAVAVTFVGHASDSSAAAPSKQAAAKEVGEQDDVTPEERRNVVRKHVHDAMQAFQDIKSDILAGRREGIMARLLDDGKALKAEEPLSELLADLKAIKELLSDPAVARAEQRDVRISIQEEYALPDRSAAPTMERESVVVSFRLTGTELVGRSIRDGAGATVERDGSLRVVLKKIDGVWRWNPFGW